MSEQYMPVYQGPRFSKRRNRWIGPDVPSALNDSRPPSPPNRAIFTNKGCVSIILTLAVVCVGLLLGHVGVCRESALHTIPIPEFFGVPQVTESPNAQELAALVTKLAGKSAVIAPTEAPATQVGSAHAAAYAESVVSHFDQFGTFYAPVQKLGKQAHPRETCTVSLQVNGATGITIVDAPWFRVVKSTCRSLVASTPTIVDVATTDMTTISSLTGDVVLLFENIPFAPLVGDAYAIVNTKPLVLQVDARLRALFTGVPTTVTSTVVLAAVVEVETYIYRPQLNAGSDGVPLTYVVTDLDAAYSVSDNWGALALQLQLATSLSTSGVPRDRTAFVFGHAGSGQDLIRHGHITNVRDVVVLTACGLSNGRDAVFTSRTGWDVAPLIRPFLASLRFSATAYTNGIAPLPNQAIWAVTSWSATHKTLKEATVAGGVAGLAVSPILPVTPSPLDILSACLIAQLGSLIWLIEVSALSPNGISTLFV